MNEERMLKLGDVIEAHPGHFDIGTVVHGPGAEISWLELLGSVRDYSSRNQTLHEALAKADLSACGTTACFAGWTLHLWPGDVPDTSLSWAEQAASVLELNADQAHMLFYEPYIKDASTAAQVLRDLVSGKMVFEDLKYIY